jgi:hypothetical protein
VTLTMKRLDAEREMEALSEEHDEAENITVAAV